MANVNRPLVALVVNLAQNISEAKTKQVGRRGGSHDHRKLATPQAHHLKSQVFTRSSHRRFSRDCSIVNGWGASKTALFWCRSRRPRLATERWWLHTTHTAQEEQ